MQSLIIRPLRLLLPIAFLLIANTFASRKYHRYFPRRYDLTLSVRNHNVTEAKFFRLNGVGHTADFYVAPGDVFTKTYEVRRKGYWTLFVEFPGDRYSKSPRKIISRDSYSHWCFSTGIAVKCKTTFDIERPVVSAFNENSTVALSIWARVNGTRSRARLIYEFAT